ncbi:MAG TPA: adenylate/guanylate cyclase domain-containing protein, partial [Lapillicoccus sp.]|nr:adenylate/guanylate cyclase domain-containing protein [Lapillicoccus sp.]
ASADAARRRHDARLVLVGLSFMAAAGFLGLHALATPGVLLPRSNAGFVVATPVGLLIASVLAVFSSLDLQKSGPTIVAWQRPMTYGLLAAMVVWAAFSLSGVPPLNTPLDEDRANAVLLLLALPGLVAYAIASWRYLLLYQRRKSSLTLALFAAYVLLAEALVAVTFGRNWHASWWEWHVLMLVAFVIVAWTARVEYRRSGSSIGTFSGLYLDQTLKRVDQKTAAGLERLVSAIERGEPTAPVVDTLVTRDGISRDEAKALSTAAREIYELDALFTPYVSPQVAERLRADPSLAALGGVERQVSVLFADLQGFTAFSETRSPAQVIGMLNRYWSAAVPVVMREDGFIERFAGDAIMVVFNGTGDQPDHAKRALRAGLGLQRAAADIAEDADWPRFRVGINSGRAVVGNVGTAEQRSFTAIGDTTNLASRLQGLASPGQVVIGETTRGLIDDDSILIALGAVEVKGKRQPVTAYLVDSSDSSDATT